LSSQVVALVAVRLQQLHHQAVPVVLVDTVAM
jgi:hypothetical protein